MHFHESFLEFSVQDTDSLISLSIGKGLGQIFLLSFELRFGNIYERVTH